MRLVVLVLGFIVSLAACAQDSQDSKVSDKYQEGLHYTTLDTPLNTLSGDKVEVAELFQYSCGHCYNFEKTVNEWKKTLPENVKFIRIPGTWGGVHAKIYYVAEMQGILATAHGKIFDAMHNDASGRHPHKVLNTESEAKAFFAQLGVPGEDFDKEINGGSVKMAMSFADSNVRSLSKQAAKHGLKVSTPSMIVAGKYYVSMRKDVPNFKAMLDVTDFLIAKESAN